MDRSVKNQSLSTNPPKPLGIFWDIENCPIPLTASASGVVRKIRQFIGKRHPECGEATKEFVVATDTKRLTDKITDSLNNNGVVISHVSAGAKNASDCKLQELIHNFIDNFADKSPTVVIITGDINFIKDVRIARNKGVVVILIYGDNPSEDLKNSANESYSFAKIIDGVEEVDNNSSEVKITYVKVFDLPNDKPVKEVLKLLSRLLANCGGKPINYCEGSALVQFGCPEDAVRACRRFIGYKLYGKECILMPITEGVNQCSRLQEFNICKSVIRGIPFKRGQNYKNLVIKMITQWKDSEVKEEMIIKVEPLVDYLVVTAVTPEANQKLLRCAEQYLRPESGIQWSEAKDYESIGGQTMGWCAKTPAEQVPDNRRSVIKGLPTREGQNVTEVVKDLVNSWNDCLFSGDLIVSVERNTKQSDTDSELTCNLFVTAISASASQGLVKGAKRHLNGSDIKWTPYKHKFQTSEECKSVIKGLDTSGQQNITNFVRNIVNKWSDPRFSGNFIVSVERNTSQKGSLAEDKCNLFVTATTPHSSRALIKGAKQYIKPEHNVKWTAYEPKVVLRNRYGSIDGSSDSGDSQESFYSTTSSASFLSNATNKSRSERQIPIRDIRGNNNPSFSGRVSIITGMHVNRGENVLRAVRKLVSDWKESRINGNMIENVEMDPIFGCIDGKIPLFVTAYDSEMSKAVVSAAQKCLNPDSGIKWTEYSSNGRNTDKKTTPVRQHLKKPVDSRPTLLPYPPFPVTYNPILPIVPPYNPLLAQFYQRFAQPLAQPFGGFPLVMRPTLSAQDVLSLTQSITHFAQNNKTAPKKVEPSAQSPQKPSNSGANSAQVSPSVEQLLTSAVQKSDSNKTLSSFASMVVNGEPKKSPIQLSPYDRLSLISGLKLYPGEVVTRTVRRMVNDWHDFQCNGNFIVSVKRNKTQTPPLLEVWTNTAHQTELLVSAAKHQLTANSGVVWTHSDPNYKPLTREETREPVVRQSSCHPNRMFVICGQKTTSDENIIRLVRELVTDLSDGKVSAEDVVDVTRDYRWVSRSGIAMLFVTVVTPQVKDLILKLAEKAKTNLQFNDYNGFKH